jgi:hypothetical protein
MVVEMEMAELPTMAALQDALTQLLAVAVALQIFEPHLLLQRVALTLESWLLAVVVEQREQVMAETSEMVALAVRTQLHIQR